MRSAAARRVAAVHARVLALRLDAGFFRVAGPGDVVRLAAFSDFTAVDALVVILLAAARLDDVVGVISMPNIPERSSLSSTFARAGPLRVFDMSDPALAIKSC